MVLRLVYRQPLGKDVVPLVMRTRITSSEVLLIDRSWSVAELPEFCIIVSRDCHDSGDDDDDDPSLGIRGSVEEYCLVFHSYKNPAFELWKHLVPR